jgi:hypothetical protein
MFAPLALQCVRVNAAPYHSAYPPDAVDILAAEGLAKLAAYEAQNDPSNKCTLETAIKRKEC